MDQAEDCPIFTFILSFVILGLTSVFGFVGNSLAIATLNRDRSHWKTVTQFLLTVLAVADIAFLVPVVVVILIPSYCSYYRSQCVRAVQAVIPYIQQYGWSLASATHMTTVYVTVLVAFHRYVYVCRPHDVDRLSGLRRAKIHVALVPIFAFLFNLPRVLEYEQSNKNTTATWTNETTSYDPDFMSVTTKEIKFTPLAESIWFKIVYKNICFYLLMYIIPLGVLIFVSVRLLQTLRAHDRNRFRAPPPNRSQQESRDNRVTIILIIIIVIFIVCQTPTVFQRLVLALTGSEGLRCDRPYTYLEHCADYLVVFNSCVNFVVYVMFAGQFRQVLSADVLGLRGRARGKARRTNAADCSCREEVAECFVPSSETSKDPVQLLQLRLAQQQQLTQQNGSSGMALQRRSSDGTAPLIGTGGAGGAASEMGHLHKNGTAVAVQRDAAQRHQNGAGELSVELAPVRLLSEFDQYTDEIVKVE